MKFRPKFFYRCTAGFLKKNEKVNPGSAYYDRCVVALTPYRPMQMQMSAWRACTPPPPTSLSRFPSNNDPWPFDQNKHTLFGTPHQITVNQLVIEMKAFYSFAYVLELGVSTEGSEHDNLGKKEMREASDQKSQPPVPPHDATLLGYFWLKSWRGRMERFHFLF